MLKKIFLSILEGLIAVSLLVSCGKKEKPKEIVYSGSVMLFSSMDANKIKEIKKDFEATYKGIVLDTYNGNTNDISQKLEESFSIDLPEADVIIVDDLNIVKKFVSNKWLSQYTSKEDKNIDDNYKEKDRNYYFICSDGTNDYMVMLVSNSLNVDNGKLLIDYLLSQTGQEKLVENGLNSVRKDKK